MRKRRGSQEQEITIIKRRGKKGHGQGGGGAWKVAFADFTMAMMALFMVLWVLQAKQAEDMAAELASRTSSVMDAGIGVFDGSSRTPLELEGVPAPVSREELPVSDLEPVIIPPVDGYFASQEELRELAEMMRMVAEEVDAVANIEVNVVPQGLRILIKDDASRFMFERGSAKLDPHFERLLERLAGLLANVDNRLIISGHTDATQYRSDSRYDNWNLSGDRALRARSALVKAGLPADAILQVAAQADIMPILPDDPTNGANRRVEILLLTRKAEELYKEIFGDSYARALYSEEAVEFAGPDSKTPAAQDGEQAL